MNIYLLYFIVAIAAIMLVVLGTKNFKEQLQIYTILFVLVALVFISLVFGYIAKFVCILWYQTIGDPFELAFIIPAAIVCFFVVWSALGFLSGVCAAVIGAIMAYFYANNLMMDDFNQTSTGIIIFLLSILIGVVGKRCLIRRSVKKQIKSKQYRL